MDLFLFSASLGPWRWPLIILLWVAAAGLVAWLVRRRRAGRPIGGRGFTLIEMALVLVIIGLVTTGMLKMFQGVANSARYTATQNAMHLAEQAITVYAVQNGCLPCPANGAIADDAANAGRSLDAGGGTYTGCTAGGCWATNGVVPWVTLGISAAEVRDGWSGRLSYHLGGSSRTGDATDSTCGSSGTTISVEALGGFVLETITQTIPPNRACTPVGSIQVNNSAGVEQTGGAGNRAIYLLISHGEDGYGAWNVAGVKTTAGNNTAAQIANAGDAGPFVQDTRIGAAGANYFDDVVLWRSGALALAKCGAGLCGNPN